MTTRYLGGSATFDTIYSGKTPTRAGSAGAAPKSAARPPTPVPPTATGWENLLEEIGILLPPIAPELTPWRRAKSSQIFFSEHRQIEFWVCLTAYFGFFDT